MLLLLLLVAPVFSMMAQSTARLTGQVVDASSSPVAGATVELLLPGASTAVLSGKTSTAGYYSFASVPAGSYTVTFRAPGFSVVRREGVKLDAARETALPATRLAVATVMESVTVNDSGERLGVTNAEVSTTILDTQVRELPVLDRQVINLIRTQAGVAKGRGFTTVHGLRASTAVVTLDGVNIQDNYFRVNALDYIPNRPTQEQVAEITITTSNAPASVGGASQVAMITPSGGNQFHGTGFAYNRNSYFAANTFFNNRDGLAKPFLNQNQLGGSIGGPIIKDKLLFYGTYEAMRLRQQRTVNRRILTADGRQGVFTYRGTDGAVRRANLLQLGGVGIDPYISKLLDGMPGAENVNNVRVGDSTTDLMRNTAGYSYLMRDNRSRNNVVGKVDYIASPRNLVSGSFVWNDEYLDRGDAQGDNGFGVAPKVNNQIQQKLLSLAWRANPVASLTNELRFGFNLSSVPFIVTEPKQDFQLTSLSFSNPAVNFLDNGRNTDTYHLMDNATWQRGRHNLQLGFQMMRVRIPTYSAIASLTNFVIGIGAGNPGLNTTQLAGISAADLTAANQMLASLAGYVTTAGRFYFLNDREKGFVPGEPQLRSLRFGTQALYLQDTFRLNPRVTVYGGLRWEPYMRVDEINGMVLSPRDSSPAGLLGNGVLDFDRNWSQNDYRNFAPNAGVAWDVLGNGSLAFRAGYSVSFVNDNHVAALHNSVNVNPGLSQRVLRTGLTARISTNTPTIEVPAVQVPTTFAERYVLDRTVSFGAIDRGMETPYVQQWTAGLQKRLGGGVLELRYVGNKATKLFRAVDLNQVDIQSNGFLDDFGRAYRNGVLAKNATGVFDPAYNAAVAGSQPLPVFAQLPSGGSLTVATNRLLIERGEVGQLAAQYQQDGRNGAMNFHPNAYAQSLLYMLNLSNGSYHSLQVEFRRRLSRGFQLQSSYVWGKMLTDTASETSEQFEPLLDQRDLSLERARSPFDLTHTIKTNGTWELPLGRRWRPLTSGWIMGGFLTWQSGSPFSILSQRGTLNRTARSTSNTATSLLDKGGLDDLLQVRMAPDGPFIIAASAINPRDGRGVVADGAAPFAGQAFSHPGFGTVGALQRRMFSGPWVINLDASLLKRIAVGEGRTVELRGEAFNLSNTPSWATGDQSIDATTFGRIVATQFDRRVLQFGVYYRF